MALELNRRAKFAFKMNNTSRSMTTLRKMCRMHIESTFWKRMGKWYQKQADRYVCNLQPLRTFDIKFWTELISNVYFYFHQIIHHLTDVVCFGALPTCACCEKPKFLFSNWTYKCQNEFGWSICGYEVKEPKRSLLKIPAEMCTTYKFLREQCNVQTRAMHPFKFFDEHGNDIVYG